METTPAPANRRRRIVYASALLLIVIVSIAVLYVSVASGGATGSTRFTTSTVRTQAASNSTSQATYPEAQDWLTYHVDNLRDADYQYLPTVGHPSLAWTDQFNGAVYAEPLVFNGSVFIATEGDSVYSVSSGTGSVEWTRGLGTPVPTSELQCGDVNPVGITGTPVIDPGTGTLYVAAMQANRSYSLFALSTADGAVLWSHPIDPPNFNATVEQERGALTLANGLVYVPFGGFAGDCGQYHGWVTAYPANGTERLLNYQVLSQREAGIWAPGGAVVGPSGSLYVATGNSGSSDPSTYDYGNAVIELSPALELQQYFAPTNWVQLNTGDVDLGSVTPVLLNGGLVFQIGKQGLGYLLNGSDLGGIGNGLFSAQVCQSSFGAAAEASDSVYVPCDNGLFALDVTVGANPSFSTLWSLQGFNCGPPIIAGGAVWAVDTTNGTLFAFNPDSGSAVFSAGIGQQSSRFTTPSAGDGMVYVAAGSAIKAFSA